MSKITLSVDPGLRESGVGVFNGSSLLRAALVKSPNKKDRGPVAWVEMARAISDWICGRNTEPEILILEGQQIYTGPGRKGVDPADLLELAGVCGAVSALFYTTFEKHSYLPRQWKGQVPPDVFASRVDAKLTQEEKGLVETCAPYLRHNVMHAIGLGWYHLKVQR